MEKFIDFLTNTASISKDFASEFVHVGKQILLKKKEYFIRQNEICKYVGLILEGKFLITHNSPGGVEYILGSSDNHDLITDYSAFINKKEASLNIQSHTNSKILVYTKEQFDIFLEYNIDTQRYGRNAAEELMGNWQNAFLSLYDDSPEERYLNMFKQHPDLFRRVPLKYIASMIGVTPETVSRIRRKIVK